MKPFREILAWHKAHALTLAVYSSTRTYPREELFGIVSQLRRAAASIAANIAEGCGRSGNAELSRFLNIEAGSANEVEYFLLLSRDLGFLCEPEHKRPTAMVTEVRQMLASLLRKVESDRRSASAPR